MGVLYDYFSAPSDEAAAAALSRVRLGAPTDDTPPLPPFDTLQSRMRIESHVVLGQLEALLTRRSYSEVVANPRQHKCLAFHEDGVMVQTLSDELQAALADADDSRLAAVALPWSQIEEFSRPRRPDLAALASWLDELAALARRALDRSERLYCRICV